MSTLSSTATTPRSSVELAKSSFKQPVVSVTSLSSYNPARQSTHTELVKSKSSGLWTSVKRHVREHHESVNAVYSNYYGQGHDRRVKTGADVMRTSMSGEKQTGQEVWEYQRGVYGRS